MSHAVALVMGVNVVDLQGTIASTSFNQAAETTDIPFSQQGLEWCVRTDSTDPFTWYEGCIVSGQLDGKPFPAPPSKEKARVYS